MSLFVLRSSHPHTIRLETSALYPFQTFSINLAELQVELFTLHLNVFVCFFLSSCSTCLVQLVFHLGPIEQLGHILYRVLYRGLSQGPIFVFPSWLYWGSNHRPPDYQADVLSPDHAAPLLLWYRSSPLGDSARLYLRYWPPLAWIDCITSYRLYAPRCGRVKNGLRADRLRDVQWTIYRSLELL